MIRQFNRVFKIWLGFVLSSLLDMLRIGFVVLAIAAVVFGYPAVSHVEDPELTAGYFQGDMKMRIDGRNGLINPLEHWPNKIVYFNVSESFGECFREVFRSQY